MFVRQSHPARFLAEQADISAGPTRPPVPAIGRSDFLLSQHLAEGVRAAPPDAGPCCTADPVGRRAGPGVRDPSRNSRLDVPRAHRRARRGVVARGGAGASGPGSVGGIGRGRPHPAGAGRLTHLPARAAAHRGGVAGREFRPRRRGRRCGDGRRAQRVGTPRVAGTRDIRRRGSARRRARIHDRLADGAGAPHRAGSPPGPPGSAARAYGRLGGHGGRDPSRRDRELVGGRPGRAALERHGAAPLWRPQPDRE